MADGTIYRMVTVIPFVMLLVMAQQAAQPVAASAHRIEELAWFSGAWETDHGKFAEDFAYRPAK